MPVLDDANGGDPGSTAASLLAGAAARDPDAWRRLADLYGPAVYGWARRAGVPAEDAADVTQEVFRAVAGAMAGYQHGRPGDTFRGWLWTVTRNKVRDFWRAAADRPPAAAGGSDAHAQLHAVAGPDPSTGAADTPTRAAARRAVEAVRGEFEDRTWRAFWGAAVDGRPAADVAAELGMTANAVYVARSRVLARLRALLADPAGR